jgi:hypothetical protein
MLIDFIIDDVQFAVLSVFVYLFMIANFKQTFYQTSFRLKSQIDKKGVGCVLFVLVSTTS